MKRLFSSGITSTFIFILSIMAILVIAVSTPGVVQAFGSLSENGTAKYMGIGISTPVSPLHIYSTTATQPETFDLSGTQPLSAMWNDYCTTGGAFSGAGFLARYARGTMASPANVHSGDRLGYNVFGGWVGNWFHTAAIEAVVDTGTVSGSSLPTYMRFLTTPNGSTTRAERMRITAAGNVGIGTDSPYLGKLHVEQDNTGSSAIHGENTGENTIGKLGHNDYGVIGSVAGTISHMGVYGIHEESGNWGYLGGPSKGVFGHSGATDDYAGYFDGIVKVAGSLATAYSLVGINYTVTATDSIIAVNASVAPLTITLPTAVGITGRQYTIKKVNAANTVDVDPGGLETIDGAASKTLSSQWQYITVVSDGANWLITANN